MRLRSVSRIVMAVSMFAMVITACIPPQYTPEELAAREIARKDSVRKANQKYCMKFLSFATTHYNNKAYADALNNYKRLFDYECVDEQMAQNVYVFMANCYRELEQLDSALIYYNEGLSIIPDNEYLWDSKLHTLNLIGDDEAILQTKVEKYSRFPENADLGEEIVELYLAMENYEDAKPIVEALLIEDPDNKNLQNMRFQCEEALGGDIRSIVEEEYHKNLENISNAQIYVGILRDADENLAAIDVLEGMLIHVPGTVGMIKELVELLSIEGQTKKVISLLEQLLEINPDNVNIYFDLTVANITAGNYQAAMSWANQVLNLDQANGQAYANRASVYEAVANNCSSSVPDFDDKLVFQIAYEDYLTAKSKGYGKSTSKIDFLKEARIPKSGDWFFNRDDYVKGGKAKPKKECYSWLQRSVTAPQE